jgi:hypothetical protein
MTRDARFWRNATIVGLVHLGLLVGLLWWSRNPSRVPKNVVSSHRRKKGLLLETERGASIYTIRNYSQALQEFPNHRNSILPEAVTVPVRQVQRYEVLAPKEFRNWPLFVR